MLKQIRNTPVNIPASFVQLGIIVVTVVVVIGVVYGILCLLATGL